MGFSCRGGAIPPSNRKPEGLETPPTGREVCQEEDSDSRGFRRQAHQSPAQLLAPGESTLRFLKSGIVFFKDLTLASSKIADSLLATLY